MLPQVFTFCDAIHELEEFAREASISAAGRTIRGAIRRAYREIISAHDWSCLRANGRIFLKACQDTGTVTYDHTGGTYERELTLSGASWPTDAINYSVRIETDNGDVVCDIDERKSDTVVTLNATMNPGADIAAGAEYTCYPRYYRLPNDYLSMDQPVEEALDTLGQYISPAEMLNLDRYTSTSGDVEYFTIMPVPDLYGVMGLYVYPYADADRTLDFVYRRKPRELRYIGTDVSESPGTITVSDGSTTVSAYGGTISIFTADHIGSILRIGTSSTKLPTGLDGLLPYAEQRTILEYTSDVEVTVDAEIQTTRSSVKYSITDPIDLDAMVYDAMMANAKMFIAYEKGAKNADQLAGLAANSLFRAKCADTRVTQRRVAGSRIIYEQRLSDSPQSNRYEV